MIKKFLGWGLILFILTYIALTIYVGANVYKDTAARSDAIVVLGAKSYKGDQYNPCLVARVQHGVELYEKGLAPKLVFSGGRDHEDNANEAETMRMMAQEMGVDDRDILLEDTSASTYENLANTSDLLRQNSLRSIVLVSEPFHLPRASLIADALGIQHTVSPAAESPCWTKWKFLSRYFLKEPLAIIWYKFTGKL